MSDTINAIGPGNTSTLNSPKYPAAIAHGERPTGSTHRSEGSASGSFG